MKPGEIEKESFRILLSEMKPHTFDERELPVVQRVIHATADFDFEDTLRFSGGAIDAALLAIRNGAPVFTDVNMTVAGINSSLLRRFGMQKICTVDREETRLLAQNMNITRAAAGFRSLGGRLNGALVAIGNAPTALLEILRMAEEEDVHPALVVGVPVGFVRASESKDALHRSGLPHITSLGRKGGSPVAAAILNGLLHLAAV